jgi:hypothetical protein
MLAFWFHRILQTFGNPALGCAETLNEVFCDKVCKYGFNKSAQGTIEAYTQ